MKLRTGVFRRRIFITTAAGASRADVEDDAHRYGARIRHDGIRVTAVEGVALRTPWTACGESVDALQRLVGMPLSPSPLAVYRHTSGAEQCTHLFDVAGLAIAHAARGTLQRQYDVDIPVADATSPRVASLYRDGHLALRWIVEGRTALLGPEPFTGRDIRTLMEWAETRTDDPDEYEAIVVLRRAWLVSGCRNHDLDDLARASDGKAKLGACYVYRAGVVERAARNVGSTLDFTQSPERLLADLHSEPPAQVIHFEGLRKPTSA